MRPDLISQDLVDRHLEVHPEWRVNEGGHLIRTLRTADYPTSVAIIASQIDIAEELDHHPIVTLGYLEVTFEVWTHDRDGLTSLDIEYVSRFDAMLDRYFAGRTTN